MNVPALSFRYERKFIPRGYALSEVLAVIRRHPALFHETFHARSINNIYFDTPNMLDYRDHVNGVPNRMKTRIRWYGPFLGHTERRVFEKKSKRGLVSGKQGYELPSFRFDGKSLRRDFQYLFVNGKMPGEMRAYMLHRHPTLVNRYHRRYFISADRLFRLTVDTEIEFYGISTNARELSSVVPSIYSVIIELKYGVSAAEKAELITNAIPFRVERCSKYITGIQGTSFV